MNDLIIVSENNGKQTVDARGLHTALEVGRDFSNWIKDRIEKYGFLAGIDYETRSPDLASESHGGQNRIEYALSVPMAKELAMVENNAKGREVRQYLIKLEQSWNTPELVIARALQAANSIITDQSRRISELVPKAEFFDQVADSKTAISMRDCAAALNLKGWGRNNLFAFLRDRGILDASNLPYREYQDRGYFRVVETSWTDDKGETHITFKTLVYQRGLDWIRKQITSQVAVSA